MRCLLIFSKIFGSLVNNKTQTAAGQRKSFRSSYIAIISWHLLCIQCTQIRQMFATSWVRILLAFGSSPVEFRSTRGPRQRVSAVDISHFKASAVFHDSIRLIFSAAMSGNIKGVGGTVSTASDFLK